MSDRRRPENRSTRRRDHDRHRLNSGPPTRTDHTPAQAVPLVPDHEWDMPSGPHGGHGAALRVPVSEGPSSYRFDRGNVSQQQLISEEPPVEPLKFMELGLDYDRRTRRKLHELDLPIRQDF